MRSRDLIVLASASALLAIAGFFVFGSEVFAEVQPPEGTAAPAEPAGHPGDVAAAAAASPDAPAAQTAAPVVVAASAGTHDRIDTHGWTKGVVKGDIQLAVSALDRIQSIAIEVVEARNPITADGRVQLPTRLIVPVTLGRGTPTFEVRDIPFSDYPYFVTVLSPGLNGSRRTVAIDAKNPLIDNLLLSITPGAPLTILVRDQDAVPYCGLDLAVLPVGEPAGRPTHKGTTDNFGSLVLENVLAGDYQIFASHAGTPVQDPQTISVQPGGHIKVQGQSHTMTIERGLPVQVTVSDRAGNPYVDTLVTATATDRIKLTVREATTNGIGIASFPHLQPGTWQITIAKDRFHRWDQQVTLKQGQDPLYLEARLVPVQR